MSDKLKVTIDVTGVPQVIETIEQALALAHLYMDALAAVPWPALRNVADQEQGGDAWNRPVSLDAWEAEWEGVRRQALRTALEKKAELAALRAENAALLPFVRAFVENCYAEWSGSEYRCGFCAAGKREHRQEQEFLNRIQEHAEGCEWREAALWLDAHAPKPEQEPQP